MANDRVVRDHGSEERAREPIVAARWRAEALALVFFTLLACSSLSSLRDELHLIGSACYWPEAGEEPELAADGEGDRSRAVRALVVADPHLRCPSGPWYARALASRDREALLSLARNTRPDVVLILGDVFDQGRTLRPAEWEECQQGWQEVERALQGAGVEVAVVPAQRPHPERPLPPARHLPVGGARFVLLDSPTLGDLGQESTALTAAGDFANVTGSGEVGRSGRRLLDPGWWNTRMRAQRNCAGARIPSDESRYRNRWCRKLTKRARHRQRDTMRTASEAEGRQLYRKEVYRKLLSGGEVSTMEGPVTVLVSHLPLYREAPAPCASADVPRCAPWHSPQLCPGPSSASAGTGLGRGGAMYEDGGEGLLERYSQSLLQRLRPAAVFSGHRQRRCDSTHGDGEGWGRVGGVPEFTVATFSWRLRDDPSVALASISDSSGAVEVQHCALPHESSLVLECASVVLSLGMLACLCIRRLVLAARCMFIGQAGAPAKQEHLRPLLL